MTTLARAASLLAASGSAALGAQFSVTAIHIAAPNSVAAFVDQNGQITLTGVIGPITADAALDISMTLEFAFAANVVAGDFLSSALAVRPDFSAGEFRVTHLRLSAEAFDGGSPVWQVSGLPFQPLQSIGDDSMRTFDIFTDTFEGPGEAFSTIADGGVGRLEAVFRWSGFAPGSTLSIDLSPHAGGSQIRYNNFIPAPGASALAALCGAGLLRRRARPVTG